MRLMVRSGSCIIVLYSVLWRSHYGEQADGGSQEATVAMFMYNT